MKIRSGFVSNSSSSSFILFFKSVPKNVSDIKQLLFTKEEIENDFIFDDDNECYPLSLVSNSILDNIKNNIIDFDEMFSVFENDYDYIDKYSINNLDKYFNDHKYQNEYNILKNDILIAEKQIDNQTTDLYDILHKTKNKEEIEKTKDEIYKLYTKRNNIQKNITEKIFKLLKDILKEKYENYKFSYVEYSDGEGDFCSFMEHGGVLDSISLVRISHH